MAFDSFTDAEIDAHFAKPKKVVKANVRPKTKPGHNQTNYMVVSDDDKYRYRVFCRQNTKPDMEDDFSCGIALIIPGGEDLILCRYNGSSYPHQNYIEKDELAFVCHIHKATERYIKLTKKPEGFAVATNEYKTAEGALYCLCRDLNISGISTTPDNMAEQELF